jgi:hypothetical protein
MGTAADLKTGAVVQVVGTIGRARTIVAREVVVLTGYVTAT